MCNTFAKLLGITLLKKSIIWIFIITFLIASYSMSPLRFNVDKILLLLDQPLVVVALLAFALTTVIGQIISHGYQLRSFKFQERERQKTDQLSKATMLFEEISSLMDKRLYLERKLLASFNDREKGLPDKVSDRFTEYNDFLYSWNNSLNKNICKIEQYFGVDIKNKYENRILKDFNWIGMLLRYKYFNLKTVSSKTIADAIDITNKRVYVMDRAMLKLLVNETVGKALIVSDKK